MFIALDGIDGCGKGTQVARLVTYLRSQGRQVKHYANPGTTIIGGAIRQLVLDKDVPMEPLTSAMMFAAATSELSARIKEDMAANIDVVCDRWVMSTAAYQGAGQRIPAKYVEPLLWSFNHVVPDLFIVMDLPVQTALERRRAGKAKPGDPVNDRYETQELDFHERLRGAYRFYAGVRSPYGYADGFWTSYHERVDTGPLVGCTTRAILVDAAPSEEEVAAVIQKHVDTLRST